MNDVLALAFSVVACFLAAALGGAVTAPAIKTWYPSLRKPSWNPPASAFGPVWTLLYLMMAIAAWLIWRTRGDTDVLSPLLLFALQLTLNVLWSVLFFGMRRLGTALLDIVALWFAIAVTIVVFARLDAVAAALLFPYLAWVSFAAILNAALYRLNSRTFSAS